MSTTEFSEQGSSRQKNELEIIEAQLHYPDVDVSFFTLFRHVKTRDYPLVVLSTISALAAGAIVPLPAVLFGQLSGIFAGAENDVASSSSSSQQSSYYTLYFVYLSIGSFALWFISTAGFSYVGSQTAQHIRVRYVEAVIRQNMGVFDSTGTGSLASVLGADSNAIQNALSHKLSIVLSSIGTLIATYAISFSLQWKLTLMMIWSFFLSIALLLLGGLIAHRYSGRSTQAQSTGSSVAEEALSSIRSITALGLQKQIINSYDEQLGKAEKADYTLKSLMGIVVAVTVGAGYLNVSLGFWQGSRLLVDGQMTFMALVAITLVTKTAAFCILALGHNAEAFTIATAAARRIFKITNRASPIDSMSSVGHSPTRVRGQIELRNIKHIYPTRPGITVADNLSISFPAGKATAIVGPSGSGKSSIAKLILRFYDPIEGEITLDGHRIQDLNIKWLRSTIRLVSQDTYLFDTTVFTNIGHGFAGTPLEKLSVEEKQQRIEAAAKIACAHDFILALPQGYQTTVGSRGSKLSGGQKQRIAIARALVAEPKVLILDEATSALDAETEMSVQAALNSMTTDRTTMIIAHRLSTVRHADKIVVLNAGANVEEGTHEDLMERKGRYFALVKAQEEAIVGESEEIREYEDQEESYRAIANIQANIAESGVDEKETSSTDVSPERQCHSLGRLSPVVSGDTVPSSLTSMLRFILRLNKEEKVYIFVGMLCSVIAGFEEPASAILFGYAIVTITTPAGVYGQEDLGVGFWSWMFFLLAAVMIITFSIQGTAFAYCSERLVHRARKLALGQMLRQEMAFFDDKRNSPGSLVNFLSTEAADLAGINGGALGMILIAISTLVSGFLVGLAFGWKLALVCSCVVPVLIAGGCIGIRIMGKFEELNEKYMSESAGYASEAISAVQTVASLTMETRVLATYSKSLAMSSRMALKAHLKASLVLALARSGVYACMALGFWYGGSLILRGEYSLLQFIVVYSSIITSAYSAGLVFSFTPDIGKAKRSAANLQTLLQRKSRIDPMSTNGKRFHKPQGGIEFRGVNFAYPTRPQHRALEDISFNIAAGSSVAFVGHTGSGKSTVVSLLERFYTVDSGDILLDGEPIESLNISDYRSCIGLVSQEPTLLQGSIRMNLLAGYNKGYEISDSALEEACRQANVLDFISSLPDGLNTLVGHRGDQLSGGQRQRLALARALVKNPAILILDEATSAIDTQSESFIQEALKTAVKGRTSVTIAHRLSTVRHADAIYLLEKGRIAEHGSHSQLMALRGKYFQLFAPGQPGHGSRRMC
ncbi:P-loop containing nucleoside triphosphate hydrolase protein [Hypomontagnella monticulosa]|nr:P-loop containing nucleoside triphosphate hydrolase protein [Hypomontagnella monticulosa]